MKIFISKEFILLCVCLILSLLIVCGVASIVLYEDQFAVRMETPKYYHYELSDFPGLEAERHTFKSNAGQELVGYTYYKSKPSKNAVVVMAHGFGRGGHNSYMNIANYFASNGYYVFAYDITGNDESQGKTVKGLSQGLIDLDYALNYIKTDSNLKGLKVMLFGHSWGGYAVTSVLNIHKDILAAVSVAGFIKPTAIIKEQGLDLVGSFIYPAMPYVNLYEKYKFGDYASLNGLDGCKNSKTKLLLIHSSDDTTIQMKNSFDLFYNEFKNDKRFKFIKLEDKGHGDIFYKTESLDYIKKITAEADAQGEGKLDYMNKYFDKKQAFIFDPTLMTQIIDFYNSNL